MSTLFNNHYGQFNCRHCPTTTSLKQAGHYSDGSQQFLCSCCGRDGGVAHNCPHEYFSGPKWLPLVLAGVSIVCPTCKRAYDLGVKIEPVYPEAGQALKAAGLGIGLVMLFVVMGDFLQGKKWRRW
jgi:hypothetical protein